MWNKAGFEPFHTTVSGTFSVFIQVQHHEWLCWRIICIYIPNGTIHCISPLSIRASFLPYLWLFWTATNSSVFITQSDDTLYKEVHVKHKLVLNIPRFTILGPLVSRKSSKSACNENIINLWKYLSYSIWNNTHYTHITWSIMDHYVSHSS